MASDSTGLSTNGTLQDVAAFGRIDARTVKRWNAEEPPRIGFIQDGGKHVYLEDSVVRYFAGHFQSPERLTDAQRYQVVQTAWREHVKLRRADVVGEELAGLRRDVQELKGLLLRWVPSAKPRDFEEAT